MEDYILYDGVISYIPSEFVYTKVEILFLIVDLPPAEEEFDQSWKKN